MNEPFDVKGYAARAMRSKGYMLKRLPDGTYVDIDADINAVFGLQWPSWKTLIEKHRLDADPERAEQILTGFGHKEIIGGASKVLETFAKHLEAQPRQGGSPDWSQAVTEENDCPFCDNRGIVSDVPCRVIRQGVEVDRKYSFACVCRSGDRFPGMRKAEDCMLQFSRNRKYSEADRLHRWRQERDAAGDTIADFRGGFRAWLNRQIQARKDTKAGTFARRQPSGSMARAYQALEAVRPPSKTKPPEQLNPERIALAAFANGDERNEWE